MRHKVLRWSEGCEIEGTRQSTKMPWEEALLVGRNVGHTKEAVGPDHNINYKRMTRHFQEGEFIT